jgi:putative spermidine/putrescine transport system substrate-binding protein
MSSRACSAAAVLALTACAAAPPPGDGAAVVLARPWEEIAAAARGQTVTMAMWTGDASINAYITGWVAPRLAERHGVTLDVVSAQGREIVNLLMTEVEAGKATSELDVLWINGENFYKLRQIDALLGPFVDALPAARLVDLDDPFVRYDFQQEVAGYEAPWGTVQLALIYDSARVASPPRDRAAIARWAAANPGRLTFPVDFTGMTLLKSLLAEIAGSPTALDGPFDEALYRRLSGELWAWLRAIKPALWKRGVTFPSSVAQLHQLFAAGEIDFTMSNNDGEVDTKILQGTFPPTARAYVLDGGTIRNSHYLGIARRAAHVAAALVTIDFLLSPAAQLEKLDPAVWGDGTVLALDHLPEAWRERFVALPARRHAPPREELERHALKEPAPEYMIRLFDDFRREVLGS